MTTQNNIFKPTIKFSQKTIVSNVNVSNDNFRIRVKIRLDSCNFTSTGTTQIVDLHRDNVVFCLNFIVAHHYITRGRKVSEKYRKVGESGVK